MSPLGTIRDMSFASLRIGMLNCLNDVDLERCGKSVLEKYVTLYQIITRRMENE